MQRKKNIKLLIIFIALIIVNAGIMLMDNRPSVEQVDRYKFTLIDTSQVNRITLKQPDGEIAFQKAGDNWQVDRKYKMDERMIGLIFAVMSSVETARAAGSSSGNEVSDRLSKNGVLVSFYSDDKVISEFYTGGKSTKTTSYMQKVSESIPYVVYIPGYSSYLAGLFELKVSDWRSKKVFETSWSSLKAVKLESLDDNVIQLGIEYQDNFFRVADVTKVDTVKMMNYLEATTNLLVDRYIEPGEFSHYDSLLATQPEFTISLQDADETKNRQLVIYPLTDKEPQRLARILPSEQMVLIRKKKVEDILAVNGDFELVD